MKNFPQYKNIYNMNSISYYLEKIQPIKFVANIQEDSQVRNDMTCLKFKIYTLKVVLCLAKTFYDQEKFNNMY